MSVYFHAVTIMTPTNGKLGKVQTIKFEYDCFVFGNFCHQSSIQALCSIVASRATLRAGFGRSCIPELF